MDLFLWKYLAPMVIVLLNSIHHSDGTRKVSLDLLGMDAPLEVRIKKVEMSTQFEIFLSGPLKVKRDHLINLFAPKGFGLMAYIQTAHLRIFLTKEIIDNKDFIPQCRDYLIFNGDEKKVCHEIVGVDGRLVGPRIFRRSSGHMEIKIHMDDYSSIFKNNTSRHVLAQLILTPYTDCWNVKESKNFWRCSKLESFSCIHSKLFCNEEVNCLFDGSVGIDEENCTTRLQKTSRPQPPTPVTKDANLKEETGDKIRQYFVPTGFIFFIIWGMITLFRKCYKCYRTDFSNSKDDMFY